MILKRIRGWSIREYALLAAMLILAVWWNLAAWYDIWIIGTRGIEEGYILFAPFVAFYLFWLRRSRMQFIRYKPSIWGILVIVTSVFLSRYGEEYDVRIATHFSALLAIFGCIVSMAGLEVFRQFLPVFFALLFLMPIPGVIRLQLAGPMQSLATSMSFSILEISGVNPIKEGNVLIINQVPVAIGEACNGMRMIFSLALVVYTFVFSIPFRNDMRLLLFVISPFIALLCNVIRLIPTSLAYGFTSQETAEFAHDLAGWLMLPLALLLLLGVVRFLKWLDVPVMTWRLMPV